MTFHVIFGFCHGGHLFINQNYGHTVYSIPMINKHFANARADDFFVKFSPDEVRSKLDHIKSEASDNRKYKKYSHPDTKLFKFGETCTSTNATLGNEKYAEDCADITDAVIAAHPWTHYLSDEDRLTIRVAIHRFEDIFNECCIYPQNSQEALEVLIKKNETYSAFWGVCCAAIINLDTMQIHHVQSPALMPSLIDEYFPNCERGNYVGTCGFPAASDA